MAEQQIVEVVNEYTINNVKYKVERCFSDNNINLEESIINYLLNKLEKN